MVKKSEPDENPDQNHSLNAWGYGEEQLFLAEELPELRGGRWEPL